MLSAKSLMRIVDREFLLKALYLGLLYSLAKPMIRYLFPSAARAARTCLLVATDPALANSTGGYWRSLERRERPLRRPDPELSAALWREAARLRLARLNDKSGAVEGYGRALALYPDDLLLRQEQMLACELSGDLDLAAEQARWEQQLLILE